MGKRAGRWTIAGENYVQTKFPWATERPPAAQPKPAPAAAKDPGAMDPGHISIILRVQAGDSDAFSSLLARHRGLCWLTLRCYAIPPGRWDEAAQAVIIGLWEAAKRFDVERGVKFSTYALFWIHQAVRRNLFWQPVAEKRLHSQTCSLHAVADIAAPADPEEAVNEVLEEKIEHEHRCGTISARNAQMLRFRAQGMTLEEIAEKYGCSRENVRQQIMQAKKRIRSKTKKEGPYRANVRE